MCYINICKTVVEDPEEEIPDEKHRVTFVVEEEVLSFPDEERTLH